MLLLFYLVLRVNDFQALIQVEIFADKPIASVTSCDHLYYANNSNNFSRQLMNL